MLMKDIVTMTKNYSVRIFKYKKWFIAVAIIIVAVFYIIGQGKVTNSSYENIQRARGYDNSFSDHAVIFIKETLFVFRNQKLLKGIIEKNEEKIFHFDKFQKSQTQQGAVVKFLDDISRKNTQQLEVKKIDQDTKKLNGKKYHLDYFRINSLFEQDFEHANMYFEEHDGKIFFINTHGIFGFTETLNLNKEEFSFTTIPSNFWEDYGNADFRFNIRGSLIYQNRLFISNVVPQTNCPLGIELLVADITLEKLHFKRFFTTCAVDASKTFQIEGDERKVINPNETGGTVALYKDNKILLSLGHSLSYNKRNPQIDNDMVGKIIAIDVNNGASEVISKGHRNPQGLHYNKADNVVLNTEHGPQGGDEININKTPGGVIENYGWPIASYGWDYGADIETEPSSFKQSHQDYGFIEPLAYFTPSIAISGLVQVDERFNNTQNKQIFVAALSGSNPDDKSGGQGISHYVLNDDYSIDQKDVIYFGGRMRDILYVEQVNKILTYREYDQSLITITYQK